MKYKFNDGPRHLHQEPSFRMQLSYLFVNYAEKSLDFGTKASHDVIRTMKKWISNGYVNCFHMAKLLEAAQLAVVEHILFSRTRSSTVSHPYT